MTFYRCSDNYDFHCYIHMAVVAVLFMARAANDTSVFTIEEKAPTRAFSWLKAPTSTFSHLRHCYDTIDYAK